MTPIESAKLKEVLAGQPIDQEHEEIVAALIDDMMDAGEEKPSIMFLKILQEIRD